MSNSLNEIETIAPIGKKVIIANKEYFIKPFVLKNRIKVVRLIMDIFGELNEKMPSLKNMNQTAILSALIGIAGERLTEIYQIVLEEDKTWLEENMQIKDEIEVVETIIEVNDFPLLLSQISQMLSGKKA